jgi:hypothetical protein
LLHKEYGDDTDKDEDEEERSIPEFTKGETIPLMKGSSGAGGSKVQVATAAPVWASLDVKEKKTTAPGHLTESELIGMMEKHGIGTDASIATHIQNIQNRNYVYLETGRRLIPNKLGLVLVQGYHQIDSGLVLPKIRSDIEGECNRIARGEMEKDEVVKRAIQIFEEKFAFFVKNIDKMDLLFGSSFSKLEDVGKPFTRCGLTRYDIQSFFACSSQFLLLTLFLLPEGAIYNIYQAHHHDSTTNSLKQCIVRSNFVLVGAVVIGNSRVCFFCVQSFTGWWGNQAGTANAIVAQTHRAI